MTGLTSEELTWLLQTVADDGKYTVTCDKSQGNSLFEALDTWFEAQMPSLYKVLNEVASGAVDDEAKERFVKAYIFPVAL